MRWLLCLTIALMALAPTALGAVGLVEQTGESASTGLMGSYQAEAPSLKGPYDEGYSPTDLKFPTPEMYSFTPEGGLSFSSATPPDTVRAGMEGSSAATSVSWYGRGRWSPRTSSTSRPPMGDDGGGLQQRRVSSPLGEGRLHRELLRLRVVSQQAHPHGQLAFLDVARLPQGLVPR
jgi:hypothetical protein